MSEGLSGVPNRASGTVIWITGLSGAGKSSIARETYELLKSRLPNVVLVDGDLFRAMVGDGLRHDPDDRLKNAYRIARFCKFLSDQGIHVVCATMSLFHECQAWNRQNIERYFEVYVCVPLDVLVRRDARGLYSRALRGDEKEVVAVDLPFQEPKKPHLIIDNGEERTNFADFAARIAQQSGCLDC